MDDNIALAASVASAVALAAGLAADSALFHYGQTKLEKMLGRADRVAAVSARLKDRDGLARSLSLFNSLFAVILTGSLLILWQRDGGWISNAGTLLLVYLVVGIALSGLIRGIVSLAAEPVVLALLGFVEAVHRVVLPVRTVVDVMSGAAARIVGIQATASTSDQDEAVEEILDAVAEGEAEGVLEEDAADFIENIMDFRDRVVREVMTPRTSMVCVRSDTGFDELVDLLNDHGHSRLPVYQENRDNIVGVVYAKDALRYAKQARSEAVEITDMMRSALFAPESKKISELLKQMRDAKVHIALVLDEFGGTAGLVTMEDIVEEIVGEIHDEFDASDDVCGIDRLDDNEVEVDAMVSIGDLNHELDIEIPGDGDYDTIAGFLSAKLGKVPAKGENFEMDGVSFVVTDADERKVKRVRVTTTTSAAE